MQNSCKRSIPLTLKGYDKKEKVCYGWSRSSKRQSEFVLSACELKNNCSLFERLFKVKKNGIFLFGISLHFRDIILRSFL